MHDVRPSEYDAILYQLCMLGAEGLKSTECVGTDMELHNGPLYYKMQSDVDGRKYFVHYIQYRETEKRHRNRTCA